MCISSKHKAFCITFVQRRCLLCWAADKHQYFRTKVNNSNCLLEQQPDTTLCVCTKYYNITSMYYINMIMMIVK